MKGQNNHRNVWDRLSRGKTCKGRPILDEKIIKPKIEGWTTWAVMNASHFGTPVIFRHVYFSINNWPSEVF